MKLRVIVFVKYRKRLEPLALCFPPLTRLPLHLRAKRDNLSDEDNSWTLYMEGLLLQACA